MGDAGLNCSLLHRPPAPQSSLVVHTLPTEVGGAVQKEPNCPTSWASRFEILTNCRNSAGLTLPSPLGLFTSIDATSLGVQVSRGSLAFRQNATRNRHERSPGSSPKSQLGSSSVQDITPS